MTLATVNVGTTANDHTGDTGQVPFNKVNLAIAALNTNITLMAAMAAALPFTAYDVGLSPSGDTTGVTDLANIAAACTIMASGKRLSGSSYVATGRIRLAAGDYYQTTSCTLTTGSTKITGLWIEGSGRGATTIHYNPATPQPMFINQRYLQVKMTDFTVFGNGTSFATASDFLWSQELGGTTNVQDYIFSDMELIAMRNINRLSGGNNNSEWHHDRMSYAGCFGAVTYTPPTATSTAAAGSTFLTQTPLGGAVDVQVGDTVSFSAAMAPLAAGTQYYCVSSSNNGVTIQVATTLGGTPISITAAGTATLSAATDQFLNHWYRQCKLDGNGTFLQMNFGGSFSFRDCDASKWNPTVLASFTGSITGTTLTVTSLTSGTIVPGQYIQSASAIGASGFVLGGTRIVSGSGTTWIVSLSQTVASVAMYAPQFMFGLLNTPSSQGVCSFSVDKLRIEHFGDGAMLLASRWPFGSISMKGVDQSSSTRGSYCIFSIIEMINQSGPSVAWDNNVFQGRHAYVTGTNGYNYSNRISYNDNQTLINPDVANFLLWSSQGNSGGAPGGEVDGFVYTSSSSGSYKYINDCTWNFTKGFGAITKTRTFNFVGSNSDLPNAGGNLQVRLPLNCIITRVRWIKQGNSNTGNYNYSIADASANTVDIFSGSTPGTATYQDTPLHILCGTDNARTLTLTDVTNRAGAIFTNITVAVDYIGG